MAGKIEYSLAIETGAAAGKLREVSAAINSIGNSGAAATKKLSDTAQAVGNLGGRTNSTTSALGGFKNAAGGAFDKSSLLSGAIGGLAVTMGTALLGAITSTIGKIREFISTGINFNASLESARIGVAAVIKQFDESGRISNFQEAMRESASLVEALRLKAAESPATFGELLQAFQSTAGAAMKSGIPLKKHIDLVTQLSQALSGLGIGSEQLTQEINALVKGMINEDAAAAKVLGITKEMIDTQVEQGTLYDFLMGKTAAFAEAGVEGAKSYNVAVSNLTDNYENLASVLSKELFGEITKDILALNEALKDPEVIATMQILGEELSAAYEAVKGLVAQLEKIPAVKALKWVMNMTAGDKIGERTQFIKNRQFSSSVDSVIADTQDGVTPKEADALRKKVESVFADAVNVPTATEAFKQGLLRSIEAAMQQVNSPSSGTAAAERDLPKEKLQAVDSEMSSDSGKESSSAGFLKSISEWCKKSGELIERNVQKISDTISSQTPGTYPAS